MHRAGKINLRIISPAMVLAFLYACRPVAEKPLSPETYCNPLSLNYRYQPDAPSRREAADPTVVFFRDKYLLFASKSGGYWWSDDLHQWNLVETDDIPIEDYAPTAVAIGDTLYFIASSTRPGPIYKSADPFSGSWQVACDSFPIAVWDPAFFLDEDKRLYLYWGCSDSNPIYGIEVDYRNNFRPVGMPVECFNSRTDIHGWERPGDRNELARAPWIEGPWMNKYRGRYYLQYAAPGTEFKSYADGVYHSGHPLGPFEYAACSPFSLKAGGFSCGAGHGTTFTDRYGNLWHMATVSISVNHMFERRLAMFPAVFDEDHALHALTGYGDYPCVLPDRKIHDPGELFTGWMLLSFNKPVQVSSFIAGHPAEHAVDEEIRSCWTAASGSAGEWISVDLERTYEIKAIQVNFADINGSLHQGDTGCFYRFVVEHSADGQNWEMLEDRSRIPASSPHHYRSLDKPVNSRFIRLSNDYFPGGNLAVSGLRIFGTGTYDKPEQAGSLKISRREDDRTMASVSWTGSPSATGYNIRYGIEGDKLYHQHMIYADTCLVLRGLNADSRYCFTIDAFNECGITGSGTIVVLE